MKCIYCGQTESRVVDSRQSEDGTTIRRRRECLYCFRRFTTYEKAEPVRLMVIKKDGTRQLFDLDKLALGIQKACEKRPVSEKTIDEIAEAIYANALSNYDEAIEASEIGKMVLDKLQDVDEVAYARFSCIYHEINDLESFYNELDRLMKRNPEGKAD